MAHNLHYVIVTAESCEDAVNKVDDEVLNWQRDENNWYSLLYCVSEDEEETSDLQVFIPVNQGFCTGFTFAGIMTEMREHISMFRLLNHTYSTALEARLHLTKMLLGDSNSYELNETLRLILATEEAQKGIGDYHTFRPYEFDQYGMTDISSPEEGLQQYIVVVDMHS